MKPSRVKKDQSYTHALASFFMPELSGDLKTVRAEKQSRLPLQVAEGAKATAACNSAPNSAPTETVSTAVKDNSSSTSRSTDSSEADSKNENQNRSIKTSMASTAAAATEAEAEVEVEAEVGAEGRKATLPGSLTSTRSPSTKPPKDRTLKGSSFGLAISPESQGDSSLTLPQSQVQLLAPDRDSGQNVLPSPSVGLKGQTDLIPIVSEPKPFLNSSPSTPDPNSSISQLVPHTPPPTPPPSRPPTPPATPPPRPRQRQPSNSSPTNLARDTNADLETTYEPPESQSHALPPLSELDSKPNSEISSDPRAPRDDIQGYKPTFSVTPHPKSPNHQTLIPGLEPDAQPPASNRTRCSSPPRPGAPPPTPDPDPAPPQPPPFPPPPSPPN